MKQWLWLIYPVLAVVFILYTAVNVVSDPTKWTVITQKRQDTQVQEQQITLLRQKLNVLSALDKAQVQEDLKYLLEIMPPSRFAWSLLSELKIAASESGSVIVGYKGKVGDVKEASTSGQIADDTTLSLTVTAEVPDIARLRRLLATLYEYKPLVQLSKLSFASGTIQMTLDGAWSAWAKEANQTGELPEYMSTLQKVREKTQSFKSISTDSSTAGEINFGVVSPF